ncbi:MAG: hypothetical protein M3P12_08225 [Gemmatimonadota bacterium]|nr:hypothetical protein [Gemmatimonadota bacterium]
MPRAYTVATAALALEMPVKWIDNILSHNKLAGIRQERQGVARRLSVEGLVMLALTSLLIHELGLPTPRAITVTQEIIKGGGRYSAPQSLAIEIDLIAFQNSLLERLERAVEVVPTPRRGRPRANKTGRLD